MTALWLVSTILAGSRKIIVTTAASNEMNDTRKSDYEKVAVLENAIEAQLMISILKEGDIPHRIRSHHDTAYDGLFQMQKGWGEIYAPASRKREIREILADLRAAHKD